MRDVTALVTGVGTATTGGQVLNALRLSQRRRYHLTVTNVEYSRMIVAEGVRKVLLPPAQDADYIPALARAANEAGAEFIFPGSDQELLRIAKDRDWLSRRTGAVPLMNNTATIGLCFDKLATARAIAQCGLRVPVTLECEGADPIVSAIAAGQLRYPVVIKPKHGGGGSANVFVAQDECELRFFIKYVQHSEATLLVQEYAGDADLEFSVSVVHYPDGALGGSMAIRRHLTSLLSTRLRTPNRTGRLELGRSLALSTGFSQGEIAPFPEVCAAAERVATHIGSTGPLNVQGRLVGSDFYVFEINPRFSGSTALRARAGHNGPEALIDWHLGTASSLDGSGVQPRRFVRDLVDHVELL